MHLTKHGLAVVAGALQPSISEIAVATVYYILMSAILELDHSARQKSHTLGLDGFSNSPRISKDGKKLVCLRKRRSWVEDEASLLVVCEGFGERARVPAYKVYCGESRTTLLAPLKVQVANDGETVFFLAEDRAEVKPFRACLGAEGSLVANSLTQGWSIEAFHLLDTSGSILLSGSTINLPRRWVTLKPRGLDLSPIVEGTYQSTEFNLEEITFESIEWPGADDIPVQAWLVKPPHFDPTRRYPLLYCIHGGPNAAFNNAWASGYWRNWNFILLAAQGYVVVAPNASGSTGFGEEYARRVVNYWGGKSYIDHVKGFAYLQAHFPFVDTGRAVALGISFGGFMVNWIQGQPLGRRFKAFATECGFVNTSALYVSFAPVN